MQLKEKLELAVTKGYSVSQDGNPSGPRGPLGLRIAGGYPAIAMRGEGRKILNLPVHQLVAYDKYGDAMFEPGIEVRHLDGNNHNNSYENLVLGTHSQNMMDVPQEKRRAKAVKSASHRRGYSDEEVAMIREDRKNGMKYKELTAKHQVSKSTLSYIFNRATY